MTTDDERFRAKWVRRGDCWQWTAQIKNNGYAVFHWNGKQGYAHRWSYEHFVGPIPPRMEVDHLCHNRACVNPSHLRTATHKQNQENRSGPTSHSSTGVRGVYRKDNKWVAEVNHHGIRYRLGRFSTIEDAQQAVIAKRNELFTHNTADRKYAR